MVEIKCPKCASENLDCYDTDFDFEAGTHWDLCYCSDCGAEFKIKYQAVEIEQEN